MAQPRREPHRSILGYVRSGSAGAASQTPGSSAVGSSKGNGCLRRKMASRWSPAVSRVLFPRSLPCAGGGHSSGPPVAGRLKRPTQDLESTRATPAGCPAIPLRSCSRWGLPCPSRHRESGVLLPRRFTLACSRGCPRAQAVCFLLHFPSSHLDWPLTSTLPREPGLSSTATSAGATIHRTPAGSRPEYSAPAGCAAAYSGDGVGEAASSFMISSQ